MRQLKVLLLLLLLCFAAAVDAAEDQLAYSKLTQLPSDFVSDVKVYSGETFRKKNVMPALGIAAATGLLIYYDEKLIDGAQSVGRSLHLGNKDNTTPYIKLGNLPIFRGPSDTGSALYFLGDGWLHFSIAGGFYSYGYLADSPRAVRTGYALLEGIIASGAVTQLLKRSTGRESPFVATAEAGKWRFFPNQKDYNKQVSHYDAFPSGHLATAMVTVTVISTNYPEYPAIAPVGYGIMTLLAFQMMNNGVHWASDYPLALSLGYSFGKIAARRSQGKFKTPGSSENSSGLIILPDLAPGRAGIIAMTRI
jgi:hypothetical protein